MSVSQPVTRRKLQLLCGALLGATLVAQSAVPAAAQSNNEIVLSITRVKALDKFDEMSGADVYARVTIDGDKEETKIVKQESFSPDWVIRKKVKAGTVNVRIELVDKDLAEDDPIDINKLPNRRPLEFTVNTKKCRVEGFSSTYKCGSTIKRAGTENKKAEITFNVRVKK